MDPDLKTLLEKNLEASRKTLETVQKLHHAVIWGRIFLVFKWGFLLVLLLLGFWQLQPYFGTLIVVYENLSKALSNLQNLPADFQELLK